MSKLGVTKLPSLSACAAKLAVSGCAAFLSWRNTSRGLLLPPKSWSTYAWAYWKVATVSSPDAATGLFNSKKAVAAGTEITGWGVPAYSGTGKDYAACGVMKQQTLTEVKMIDKSQTSAAMVGKLQAVMKEVASRK